MTEDVCDTKTTLVIKGENGETTGTQVLVKDLGSCKLDAITHEGAHMSIRVVQIKVYPAKGDLKANHRRLMSILDQVAGHKPDVVVTPECFLDGYVSNEEGVSKADMIAYAIDPATSPYVKDVSAWAAAHKSWFVFGCTRAASKGVYNTALVFDRAGRQVDRYDKTHLQRGDLKYEPGQKLEVFPSDFGPFGVLICADRRWPETVRTLALKGARVIFTPTYGMHDERNLCMMRTRSYESEVVIVFTHPGQSLVTGPTGEIIRNETSEGSFFAVSDIDLSEVDEARATDHAHLKDRRSELYEW